jgi:hypothetical protein
MDRIGKLPFDDQLREVGKWMGMNLTWLRPAEATLEPIQGKLSLQKDDPQEERKKKWEEIKSRPLIGGAL